MELKNEALQNLWVRLLTYNSCVPKSFINLFMECDEAIEGEIAAIKAELTDANQRKDIYHSSADHLRNMALEKGDELRKANNKISDLEEQLANAKQRLTLLENSRTGWRSRAQHAEKRVMDLNEMGDALEKEINTLKKKIHELEEENIHKRPWHGDVNAMTGTWTCCKSLAEAIEFQNKKIEELEAEKARLKEAYDIHESTIERLKLLLGKECEEKEVPTGDHEFEFGDIVFVPWSCNPYMYIHPGELYNPRTNKVVCVGKTQHLIRTGDKFEIK